MCCKNSYVVKKNEFNIEQYQKEIEDQKLKGKTNNTENLPQKSKRNKDFLDKHIKESTNKTFTINNESDSQYKLKLDEYIKTARKLTLKVKNNLLRQSIQVPVQAKALGQTLMLRVLLIQCETEKMV